MKNTNKASFSTTALSEQADFPKGEAFSLVELMLSLIIISLIAAAFTPIITKKLKTSSIYAGGGAQEISDSCSDFGSDCSLCTKTYCISCSKSCSSGQYVDSKECKECKSCSSTMEGCEECESAAKCTKCQSGNNGYILQSDGTCKKCEGATPYSTGTECSAKCIASNGYYCDTSGILKTCTDKYGTSCATCDNDKCTGCVGYHFMENGQCISCTLGGCASCKSNSYCYACEGGYVMEESTHTCKYVYLTGLNNDYEGCSSFWGTTTNYGCNSCAGGYYYNTDKHCTKCELTACLTCQNGQSAASPKCSMCKGGYYLNSSGNCLTCASKYGTNCATCDSSNCLSCASGYGLSEDTTNASSCKNNDSAFTCSDSNFMRIGNLCITRKNMGDSTTLAIPSSANVISVEANGDYCYSATNKCCWTGNTGGSCNADNGGYSGCNRTVCNWDAANAICANYKYAGKTWRLPTLSEMSSWYYHSAGLGVNGLQLCDRIAGYNSAACGIYCVCRGGADRHACHPYHFWSSNVVGLSASTYAIGTGVTYQAGGYRTTAFSVRCVTEMND